MKLFFLGLASILAIVGLSGCPSSSSNSSANYGVVTDFAKPCAGGSQCESERCIEMEGIYGCSMYCYGPGECQEGFYCAFESEEEPAEEGGVATARGLCRPVDTQEICSTCSNDTMCEVIGGFCQTLPTGTGHYCLMNCELDDCPAGFTCSAGSDGASYCYPDTEDCSCNMLREGAIRSCALSNEYGECPGTIQCLGDAGWTSCQGEMPGPESCDGIDNNCDGNIDEGLLGTIDHCSECFDECQGSGLPGTTPVCVEGACALDCFDGFYDANDNPQDGCECDDDTIAAHNLTDVVSSGIFSDCDNVYMNVTAALIPGGSNHTGPADYYKFNYENKTFCQENLQVKLKVYTASKAHYFCVSGANDTNEANWNCQTVNPGSTVTIKPYDNEGTYYIKISLRNPGELNCMPYELQVVES